MVDAELIARMETPFGDQATAYFVIWRVPKPLRGSRHSLKYRLAFVVDDVCVVRYDNEAGKGDHRHVGNREYAYEFVDLDQLRRDFVMDAERWLREHPRA